MTTDPRARPDAVAGVRVTDSHGFAITAALTLGFGGAVLPIAGWAIGAVLVSLSPRWRTLEKAFAIAAPVLLAGLVVLIAALSGGLQGDSGGAVDPPNPLLPGWYDLGWMGMLLTVLLLVPASGAWLLWRLRGRRAQEA